MSELNSTAASGDVLDSVAPESGGNQRTEIGRVTSNLMEQTAVVLVERQIKHPVYGKYMRRSRKYHVHDPENTVRTGDVVQIRECRPISKTKTWKLDKVLEQARE